MEIKLNFKEKEFRDLYENSYTLMKDELKKKVNDRKKTRNILFICSAFTLLITLVDRYWITYCLIFLLITFFFIGWTEILKLKIRKFIRQSRKEVDDFVVKIKLKKNLKYSWDDDMIRYYESAELVDTYQWKDLIHFENNIEYFILHFSNNKPTIMIPRTMIENKEELVKFESKIEENI